MSQPNDPWSSQGPYASRDADLYGDQSAAGGRVIQPPADRDFWRISPEYPLNPSERKPSIFSIAGRMNRMSYLLQSIWHVILAIGAIVLMIVEFATWFVPILSSIVLLLVAWANVTIQIKRAHDCGFSGLWLLLYFVPVTSPVIPFLVILWPGQPYANRYGNPT